MAAPSSLAVRVASGDVSASLLRPHQVLIAAEDAARLSVNSHSLWRLIGAKSSSSYASTSPCLLQLVCDRRAPRLGGLPAGVAQLHPWAMDALGLLEGDAAVLQRPTELIGSDQQLRKVVLAVVTRSPQRTTTTASSSSVSADTATSFSSLESAAAATYSLLPESVRSGLVNLRGAIARQLRAMYATDNESLIAAGDLVPIQIMGETFVFRVVNVEYAALGGEDDGEDATPSALKVDVLGDSVDRKPVGSDVDSVVTEMLGLQLTTHESGSEGLSDRLWQLGFCGYTSFVQDTLFHVLLNFSIRESVLAGDAVAIQSLASRGIIVHGAPGVGKSLALRVLDSELQRRGLTTWRIDAMSLLMEYENSKVASAYEFLLAQFQQFVPTFGRRRHGATPPTCAAGVVLIDDIHALFQPTNGQDASDTSEDDQGGLLLMPLGSALLRFLDSMADQNVSGSQRLCIVGIATTGGADGSSLGSEGAAIPTVAKRSGRFDKLIEMIVPSEAMRRELLARHLGDLTLDTGVDSLSSSDTPTRVLATRLAALTGGYVAKDLVRICRSAYVHAFSGRTATEKTVVTWDHLVLAQRQIKPSQLQQLNVASPSTELENASGGPFAGYEALQKQLGDFIDWKFHPSQAMKHLGVANASGLLIHGPSGCGKSLLVKALAAKAKVNFVSVKSSELLSKFFGDSERAVRELFARARAASPCLLFFDEFDSIAHKRSFGGADSGGGDGSGVYARILSTFLNEMDGVGASRNRAADVLVVAATNRMDALDAALIRPGRIDKSVELGYPQPDDCKAILEFYTRKMPLASDVDLVALARRPTGIRPFSGADLAAVCKEAAFRSLRENMDAQSVGWSHFVAAWDQRAGL